MARKSILFILSILFALSSYSQSRKIEKYLNQADEYFNANQYLPAIQIYESVIALDQENIKALYQLGECLRLSFSYSEAEQYYQRVSELSDELTEALFYMALMRKMNGNFKQAIKDFETFEAKAEPNQNLSDLLHQSRVEKRGCFLALETKEPSNTQIQLFPTPINSIFNDYAASYSAGQNQIVVSSGRPLGKNKIDDRIGEALSNNYLFSFQANSWQLDQSSDFDNINSKFGDGAGMFNQKKDKFYFTSCQEEGNCAIYVSNLVNNKWQKPVKLNQNINQPESDNKQPCINATGDSLYFVSNRTGGKGKNDIWISIAHSEDDWSPPRNIENINTPFNDISPFYYDQDNLLFFASEGHHGFGGLDIFMAWNIYDKAKIVNIGKPYNSHYDDCYFSLTDNVGLLASNRSNGMGKFDIYQFVQKNNKPVIANFGHEKPFAARITQHLESRNFDYFYYYDRSNDQNNEGMLASNESEKYEISGKVIDGKTGKPVANVTVPLLDKEGKKVKETKTNQAGIFKYQEIEESNQVTLADHSQPEVNQYVIQDYAQQKKKYFASNRTENIYFDFNSHHLRQEAKLALDDLADFCHYFPDIQIEIDAHTDNVGSTYYNKVLSKRRAETVYKYLIKKGIDPTALVMNALGKSNPYASNNGELGRQLNRRVEFSIKGVSTQVIYPTSTYIIKPKTNLYRLSLCFDMTIQDIKLLNGISSNKVEAYRPIRVYNKNVPDPNYVFIPLNHAIEKSGTTAYSITR